MPTSERVIESANAIRGRGFTCRGSPPDRDARDGRGAGERVERCSNGERSSKLERGRANDAM